MSSHREEAGHLAGVYRRPSLFRRLFYREDPFVPLDGAELRAIFDAFCCATRLHPAVLYWIHQLGEQEYLITGFRHRSMARYQGMEIVYLTSTECGYYRLPGARKGGRGHVPPGVYPFAIAASGGRVHEVGIRKDNFGQLHLADFRGSVPPDAGSAGLPLRHPLDRSKFADEMRSVVEAAIEWDYQCALLGDAAPGGAATRAEMGGLCAGITRKGDALLAATAMLDARLAVAQ